MLKQRLMTALILLPLFIWGILSLSADYFSLLIGIFIIIGAWEWTAFMRITQPVLRLAYCAFVASILILAWYGLSYGSIYFSHIIIAAVIWWCIAIALVIQFPKNTALWSAKVVQLFIGLIILVPTWIGLVALKNTGELGGYWVLALFILIWAADTGAYFGGRRWGKTKLAREVSPGKSREGVFSGLVAVSFCVLIMHYSLPRELTSQLSLFGFMLLSLITAAFSVLGDLTESMFKRHVGIKDSGKILPGHGGVLDRIDSVTAASPVFVFGLALQLDSIVVPGL